MENMATFFELLNWVVIVLVLCSGLFAKKYLDDIDSIGRFKISLAVKTLIVASFFVSFYALMEHWSGNIGKGDISSYFFSYCVATSFYELILKGVIKFLERKLGVSE